LLAFLGCVFEHPYRAVSCASSYLLDYDHPCYISLSPFNLLKLLGFIVLSPFQKEIGKFPKKL
jgi:hypothetical protein